MVYLGMDYPIRSVPATSWLPRNILKQVWSSYKKLFEGMVLFIVISKSTSISFSAGAVGGLRGPCLPWNFQNLCKINNFSVLNANCFLVTSFRLLFFENYKDNNGMEGLEVVMYFSSFFLLIWYVFTFYRHEICLLKIVTCF